MRISSASVDDEGGRSELRFVTDVGDVFFSVPTDYRGWLNADRHDAAVLAMLPLAMKRGEDIHAGRVSARLLHHLHADVIPILRAQRPELRAITVHGDPVDDLISGRAVLTGMSRGVDSFSTALAYLDHPAEALRISHFTYHDLSLGASGEGVYDRRLEDTRRCADDLGRPVLDIRSNAATFKPLTYQQHHTLWAASMALALARGVGTYLYSSTVPYRAVHVGPGKDVSYADPILLPLLSAGGVRLVSANAHLTRVEKTALLADNDVAMRWLDVCVAPSRSDKNCSRCWKCARTLLTLELMGKLEQAGRVFDLSAYRQVRHAFIAYAIAHRKDPLIAEIIQLADERGASLFTLPRRAHALARTGALRISERLPGPVRWRIRQLAIPF